MTFFGRDLLNYSHKTLEKIKGVYFEEEMQNPKVGPQNPVIK